MNIRQACMLAACMLLAAWSRQRCALAGFAYDDERVVVQNPVVLGKVPWAAAWSLDFWGSPLTDAFSHASFRPFATLSYVIEHWMRGIPRGRVATAAQLRSVSFSLHALNTSLVWFIVAALLPKHTVARVLAAALFAVHPVQTDVLCNVANRCELLSAAFALASLLCTLQAAKRGAALHAGVLVSVSTLATCSVLSKETGATILLVNTLAAATLAWCRKGRRACLQHATAYTGVALAVAAARLAWQQARVPRFLPSDNILVGLQQPSRALTQAYLLAYHASLLVWPHPLALDRSYFSILPITSLADVRMALVAALCVSIIAGSGVLVHRAVPLYRQHEKTLLHSPARMPIMLTLMLAMWAASMALLTNVPVELGFTAADRVLYLPSAFTAGLVGALFAWSGLVPTSRCTVVPRRCTAVTLPSMKHALGVASAALLFSAAMSMNAHRAAAWDNEAALWAAEVDAHPGNAKAWYTLGVAAEALGRIADAKQYYQTALRVLHDLPSLPYSNQSIAVYPDPMLRLVNLAAVSEKNASHALSLLDSFLAGVQFVQLPWTRPQPASHMSWQSTPLIPESLDHVLAHEASAPADPWTVNPLQWGASPDVLDSAVTACRISGSARILAPAHRVSQEHVGALGGMFYNAASLRSSLQRGATRAVLRDLAHAAASLIATPRVRYMPDLALRLSAAFQAVGANALADKWAIIAHQWLMQRIMEPLHPRLVSVHAVAERAVTTALSRVCDARVQPCALALLEAGVDDGDDLIQLAQALEDGTHVATLPADDGDAAGQAVSPPVPAGDSVQSARLRSVVNSAPVRQPTAHCMHLDWLADAARDAALAGSVPGSRMCVGAGELHAALMPDAAVSAQSCADALRPLLATLEPAISALRESASAVDEAGVSPACSCGDAAGVSLFGAPAYVCAPAVLYNVSAMAARATPHGLLAELVAESGCADSVFGAPAAVAPWFAVDGASAHPTVMSLPNVLQRVSHASVVLSAMMQSSGDAGLAPKSSVFSRPRSMVTAAWAAVRATCAC